MMYCNRIALITGGASGIGKCLAEHLCANGATVICADINVDAGNAVVKSLNSSRGARDSTGTAAAHFVLADVTAWASVCEMFRKTEELLNKNHKGVKLDFVFANAGVVGKHDPNFSGEPDLADIKVDLIGVAYTLQAAMSYFLANKYPGRIIVTASQASLYPLNDAPLYSAAKHAVLALVRSTGRRAIRNGIMINAVGPGITESNITSKENQNFLVSLGWYTSKETILRAFDVLLAPSCNYSGKFINAVGDTVSVQKFAAPTINQGNSSAKL